MALTTFTAAQVLTAAQMNAVQGNDYNQTVSTKTASYTLVAADKGTRVVMNVASANTVTVNTSLFSAGDTLVIQNIGAGVTTVTAGTATVSSAGPLAIPQYGSGTLYFTSAGVAIFFPSAGPAPSSALTLITNTSFSGSTVTLSNVFSATYQNYLVKMSNVISASSTPRLRFRFGAGTDHNYNLLYYGPNSTGNVESFGSAVNYIDVGQISSNANPFQNFVNANIFSPFLSIPTGLDGFSGGYSTTMMRCTGIEQAEASYTDLVLSNDGASISMSGSIQVYGYGL